MLDNKLRQDATFWWIKLPRMNSALSRSSLHLWMPVLIFFLLPVLAVLVELLWYQGQDWRYLSKFTSLVATYHNLSLPSASAKHGSISNFKFFFSLTGGFPLQIAWTENSKHSTMHHEQSLSLKLVDFFGFRLCKKPWGIHWDYSHTEVWKLLIATASSKYL